MGLSILPQAVVVHYGSIRSTSTELENELAYYRRNDIPHLTLRDGEALLVDGDLDTATMLNAG